MENLKNLNEYLVYTNEIKDIEEHSKNLVNFLDLMCEYLKYDSSKKIMSLLCCFYFRRDEIIRLNKFLILKSKIN